jgi:hypothetical protein
MFQYAAGRALANRLRAQLCLGLFAFGEDPLAAYALDCFEVDETTLKGKWTYARHRLFHARQCRNVVEPHFHFWPDFFEVQGSCSLQGYWQSPKYFESVADEIGQVFRLDRFSTQQTREIEAEIASVNTSVSVHVRRCDYLNPDVIRLHGLCERAYYDQARQLLETHLDSPEFFVFSDDPQTAEEELGHWDNTKFVSGFGPMQDLMLMSRCSHHIIANSTFSWWGAWLDSGPDNLVVAPRQWFTSEATHNTKDLYPESWILV